MVVPGTWHGKFKKEWPTEEEKKHRDVLAARNILRKGISELESMGNSSDSNIGVSCVCIQESHSL